MPFCMRALYSVDMASFQAGSIIAYETKVGSAVVRSMVLKDEKNLGFGL